MSNEDKRQLTNKAIVQKLVVNKAPLERDWPAWISAYPTISKKLDEITDELIEMVRDQQPKGLDLLNEARRLYLRLHTDLYAYNQLEEQLNDLPDPDIKQLKDEPVIDTEQVKTHALKRLEALESELTTTEIRVANCMDQRLSRLLALWASIYGLENKSLYAPRLGELYKRVYYYAGLLPPREFDLQTVRTEMMGNTSADLGYCRTTSIH